ncbi:MAG TPA: DivIVA domain-containing protein [Mycobacteriales bacterium]|nr:DivIVA domain-containing protein [Mycobacteriales bacterium]
MVTVLAVIGVLAVLFVAGVVATRGTDGLAPAEPDRPDLDLPEGLLQPEDVGAVRVGVALRGYRMAEVDEVLERLGRELAERDARLATLTGQPAGGAPGDEGAPWAMTDPEALLTWESPAPADVAPAEPDVDVDDPPSAHAPSAFSATTASAESWGMPEVTPPDSPLETASASEDPEAAVHDATPSWPASGATSGSDAAPSVVVTPVDDAPPPGPPVEDVLPSVERAPEPGPVEREQAPREP